ncbi:alpha/beta fold hydrolase [Streptomyces sp. IBSNAI002]|uniref:alpha/beta fold hydrolase n=1 Tax=Streptomyces sp. IBSNAI002 TaxID=3457500 RepID=UPI003FCF93A4
MRETTTVRLPGRELFVEAFGTQGDPVVLLVAGTGACMLDWDREFCARLAAGRRRVLRYDGRDTGRSTTCPPGSPDYDLHGLASDAIGILDAHGVGAAHLVGLSQGGAVCQLAALTRPDRVTSLTLVSSSPGDADPERPTLPPTPLETRLELHNAPWPQWSDHAAVAEYLVFLDRLHAGAGRDFDEDSSRDRARKVVERAGNIESSLTNHYYVEPVAPWRGHLAGIRTPTLVIHGAHDRLLPLEHGLALSREIPGARMTTLPLGGHGLDPGDWAPVISEILDHTRPLEEGIHSHAAVR